MNPLNSVSNEAEVTITQELLDAFDDDQVSILAKRLEEDDYPSPFE